MYMKHRPAPLAILIIAASLALGSCGVYTFNPGGKSTIESIAVEPFENNTTQLGLEDLMTNGVIDAFISDGNLKVAAADNAEALLNGTLLRYDRRAYGYTADEQVESYAVVMEFEITLVNSGDGSEIWKEQMSQTGVYDLNTETEADGQRRALDLLVDAIINRTTKSW